MSIITWLEDIMDLIHIGSINGSRGVTGYEINNSFCSTGYGVIEHVMEL